MAIAFVGSSGVQMGWLASQADMLYLVLLVYREMQRNGTRVTPLTCVQNLPLQEILQRLTSMILQQWLVVTIKISLALQSCIPM